MNYILTKTIQSRVFIAALLLIPGSAFAGTQAGMLIHAPAAVDSVPTLSGMMMIVFSLLLGVVAYRLSKQNKSGGSMAVILLGVAGLVSGTGGIKLMSDAYANIINNFELTEASGGEVQVNAFQINNYTNVTGVEQQVVTITLPPPRQCGNFPNALGLFVLPECFVGITLNNGGACFIDCRSITE